MNLRDLTLHEVIDLFKEFNLKHFEVTLNEAVEMLENDFVVFTDAEEVWEVVKDDMDRFDIISTLEDAVRYSYNFEDIIEDHLEDNNLIKWDDNVWIQYVG